MFDAEATAARLRALSPWLHDFDLPAPLRVPIDPPLAKRIRQRQALIVPRVLEQYGRGDLAGLHVLDLGANAGAWGRAFAERGAAVTCVEPRAHYHEQARAIAELIGGAEMRWVQDSAEAFLNAAATQFDVVLCLGLLYHARDAFALLRAAVAACADLLVIDSHCLDDDTPFLELRREDIANPTQGICDLVTLPSRGALYWMARACGMRHLMELANVGDLPDDYLSGTRCAMLVRRERALVEPPRSGLAFRGDELCARYPEPAPATLLVRSPSRPRH